MTFPHEIFKVCILGYLGFEHFAKRLYAVTSWITKFRRNHMGLITEAEALAKLIPAIEKTITDAKSASTDPAVLQVITDLETIVSEVKIGLNPPAGV